MSEPDFVHLGISTPFSADQWRDAWDIVSGEEPRLWPILVAMVETGTTSPRPAALGLVKAPWEPVGPL